MFCTGSALNLGFEEKNVDAIVNAWYGGQAGGQAVADVIFGDYNPAGRLPVTFYNGVDQLPSFEDYTMKGRTYRYFQGDALYPFGYGLSYTKFGYSNGKYSNFVLSVDVSNSGSLDGEEVVQVYVKYPSFPEEPLKSLKGFKRVLIPAGTTKTVTIRLEPNAFETYNEATEEMVTVSGNYLVCYGSSSDEKDLTSIEVQIP